MNHAIWPEGQPEQSFGTKSGLKAVLHLLMMQFVQLSKFSKARRMRHAISQGVISPFYLEESMRKAGATPPPGGWQETKENNKNLSHPDTDVRTHSII